MKYFYFLLVGILTLAALYTLTGLVYLKHAQYQIKTPKAAFQVIENGTNDLTIIDFTNYKCGYCKGMHPTIKEALSLQKNIKYVVRPIPLQSDPKAAEKQEPVELEKIALAAGIQGKFQEMHDSFMEYPEGIIPQDIIKETAELYGINYDQLITDAKGPKVQKYLDDNLNDMMQIDIQSIPSYVVNNNIYVVSDKMPDLQKILTMIENEKSK